MRRNRFSLAALWLDLLSRFRPFGLKEKPELPFDCMRFEWSCWNVMQHSISMHGLISIKMHFDSSFLFFYLCRGNESVSVWTSVNDGAFRQIMCIYYYSYSHEYPTFVHHFNFIAKRNEIWMGTIPHLKRAKRKISALTGGNCEGKSAKRLQLRMLKKIIIIMECNELAANNKFNIE